MKCKNCYEGTVENFTHPARDFSICPCCGGDYENCKNCEEEQAIEDAEMDKKWLHGKPSEFYD
jgi:hypothetical protein